MSNPTIDELIESRAQRDLRCQFRDARLTIKKVIDDLHLNLLERMCGGLTFDDAAMNDTFALYSPALRQILNIEIPAKSVEQVSATAKSAIVLKLFAKFFENPNGDDRAA